MPEDARCLRIYADFNGLVRGVRNPARTAVVLDTWGSLRDLCNAGVVLQEGLPLIAVDWSDDDEDLQGHGTAEFDPVAGWWVVEFDEVGVRHVPAESRTEAAEFRCASCRVDLANQIEAFDFNQACPKCGTLITLPFAPPAHSEP